MFKQKSYVLTPENAEKKWWLIDAENMVVGRLATEIATVLRGKHKATFTPHTDSGDYVVVVNAEKVKFTGNKLTQKKYYKHSGFTGNLKQRTAQEQLDKHPELVLSQAVKRMLPKGTLGTQQLKKLKLFVGPEHTHQAQDPQTYEKEFKKI